MTEYALIKRLLSIEGLGAKTLVSLYRKFGSAEEILRAEFNELVSTHGVSNTLAKRILNARENSEKIAERYEEEFRRIAKSGVEIVSYWDEKYPETLRNIASPPVLLYLIGNADLLASQSVAVVGTRKPTRYGLKQTEIFTEELVRRGLTIVSGLARGIDTRAHKTALAAEGKTIAVLGSGPDYVYPPENKTLFREIAEKGLIVTEYPPGTKPDAMNFPRRNRIISGLSLGTLVVETKVTGGALRTAAYALEQGREVFAVPGNADSPQSEGTNRLIQRGEAKLVTNANDVLDEFLLSFPEKEIEKKKKTADISSLDVFEQRIFEILSEKPLHIDKIAESCEMSSSECSVYLLNLELKGFVAQLPGKYFVKA